MAAVGTLIDHRHVITTCCWVVMRPCADHGYHWWCCLHGEGGADQHPAVLMGEALAHTHLHISDDDN